MLDFVNKMVKSIFGDKSERDVKEIMPIVDKVHEFEKEIKSLSHDDLRAKTNEFKQKIISSYNDEETQIVELKSKVEENDELSLYEKEDIYAKIDELNKAILENTEKILNEILPEAFAVVRETARRFTENESIKVKASDFDKELAITKNNVVIEGEYATYSNSWIAGGSTIVWNMVHYDVQLVGGVVLHQGKIAEMATGEGKTLVATLPVYLNALSGRGVHVVTVNNYLAKRDSEWMAPLFEFLGLSVDCVDKFEPHSEDRKKAYRADITYGTNNEFGFDYLRDNMVQKPGEVVQRPHHYTIVDEVDSVLIDDARTPLIISGPTGKKNDESQFQALKPMVEKLIQAQRSYINTVIADAKKNWTKKQNESIGKKELDKLEEEIGMALLRAHRGLPKTKSLIKFLSETGVKTLLQKTENFYMQDQSKEMYKVDEALFFVIDEKNNSIELSEKGLDLLTEVTDDQEFFILPDIGGKINDLEKQDIESSEKLSKKDEIISDYSVKAERLHIMQQLLKAFALFEKDVEYVVMDNKVKIVDEQTGRIMEGRRYSDGLHQAIETKENVKVEASTQTFATVTLQNYFRMYNKLAGMTGTAETEAGEFWEIYKLDVVVIPTNRPIVRDDREDLVYKTVREKYNAVIDDIVKLTGEGRPVLVGTTSVEVSELLGKMLNLKGIKHNVLNAKLHQKEADIVAHAGQPGAVTIATNMAGRGTDIKLGTGVKEAGGLAIIGTERHESRRVDRQLRGRSGRQGDTGSSQFYVSLEDNLMRLFGSERIAKLMDRMGLEEGEVIQHSMISKSIERAQKKVEENNFGIRKRLLEYDDAMNKQREVIYGRRKHALYGDKLSIDLLNTYYDVCANIVEQTHEARDYEGLKLDVLSAFGLQEVPFSEDDFLNTESDILKEKLFDKVEDGYRKKLEVISHKLEPGIKDLYEKHGATDQPVRIDFTDKKVVIPILFNIEKSYQTKGKSIFKELEKTAVLWRIDIAWKEHLREMDDLKQSVHGAVYEQKDPLVIYKLEAFNLFQQMLADLNKEITTFLFRAGVFVKEQQGVSAQKEIAGQNVYGQAKMSRNEAPVKNQQRGNTNQQQKQVQQHVRDTPKVGRNEPCPCGSGKKYKHCHGKLVAQ